MKKFFGLILPVLLFLLSSAANAAQDSNELFRAILDGASTPEVEALIRDNADAINPSDGEITPLMAAAVKGNSQMVKLLLAKGAKPNATAQLRGRTVTAFDMALLGGHDDVAELLPAYGPDGKVLQGEARKQRVQEDKEARKAMNKITRLNEILSWMDPVKLAQAMYYQEQGGFPGKAETYDRTYNGKPTPPDSIWNAVGFNYYPTLPPGIDSVSYIPFNVRQDGSAESFSVVLTLGNFGTSAIVGQLLAFSLSDDLVIKGSASATTNKPSLPANVTSLTWYYSCHQTTEQPVDSELREIFSNGGVPVNCR